MVLLDDEKTARVVSDLDRGFRGAPNRPYAPHITPEVNDLEPELARILDLLVLGVQVLHKRFVVFSVIGAALAVKPYPVDEHLPLRAEIFVALLTVVAVMENEAPRLVIGARYRAVPQLFFTRRATVFRYANLVLLFGLVFYLLEFHLSPCRPAGERGRCLIPSFAQEYQPIIRFGSELILYTASPVTVFTRVRQRRIPG